MKSFSIIHCICLYHHIVDTKDRLRFPEEIKDIKEINVRSALSKDAKKMVISLKFKDRIIV